jgi:hypothetical protein
MSSESLCADGSFVKAYRDKYGEESVVFDHFGIACKSDWDKRKKASDRTVSKEARKEHGLPFQQNHGDGKRSFGGFKNNNAPGVQNDNGVAFCGSGSGTASDPIVLEEDITTYCPSDARVVVWKARFDGVDNAVEEAAMAFQLFRNTQSSLTEYRKENFSDLTRGDIDRLKENTMLNDKQINTAMCLKNRFEGSKVLFLSSHVFLALLNYDIDTALKYVNDNIFDCDVVVFPLQFFMGRGTGLLAQYCILESRLRLVFFTWIP